MGFLQDESKDFYVAVEASAIPCRILINVIMVNTWYVI